MPLAHLCLEHAQEGSAAAASKGLDTKMQSSHLEMPVSAGLALNPPSHGQMQMQNGDACTASPPLSLWQPCMPLNELAHTFC